MSCFALSASRAEGASASGSSRSAGRVLGGGFTSLGRGVDEVEETGVTRFSVGRAEVDGRECDLPDPEE